MSDNMHTPSNPRIPAPQESPSPSPDIQSVHPYPRHSSVDSTTISTQNSDPRPLIRPRGFGFEGSKNCVYTITQSFKAHFVGPWPTFSDVPNEVKDIWFETFSRSFRWERHDNALIRKNWEKICRRRLSDHLARDRERFANSCPSWIGLPHWRQLPSHWKSDEFKRISTAAKRNRSLAGPTHTGGSISFTEHEDRARSEHGPTFDYSEFFQRLHVFQSGPNKGEFMNERSKKAMEDVVRLKEHYSHVSSSSGSVESSTIPTDKHLFVEACGGFKKGISFGLGSESPQVKSQYELTTPTPTMIQLANKVAELEEKVKKVAELEEKVKEKDNTIVDIRSYLKQIAERDGSSPIPAVPSNLIHDEGTDH